MNIVENQILYPVGHHASGKSEMCSYLHKEYGSPIIETGAMMRQLYAGRDEQFADFDIESYVIARRQEDEAFFARLIDEKIEGIDKPSQPIIVNGMRAMNSIKQLRLLRPNDGHSIVWLNARLSDMHLRYEGREGSTISLAEFEDTLARDRLLGLEEIKGLADFEIDNFGSIDELYLATNALVSQIRNKNISNDTGQAVLPS